MMTEGSGLPVAVAIDGANRNDFKMTEQTILSVPINRPEPSARKPQNLCLDKGYDYNEVRELLETFGFTAHIRARGEEAQLIKKKAGFKARRWVVERVHIWLNRFRRILIRWEKKAENYLAMLHLSCGIIVWRAVTKATEMAA